MAFSAFNSLPEEEEAEFCRHCGVTVTWTGEDWVHDYPPEDDHLPDVPWRPDFEELL